MSRAYYQVDSPGGGAPPRTVGCLEDTAIVQMVIELARALGIEVIAEGVDSEVVSILKEMGCDLAQGFFFSEPVPPEDVPRFLAG